MRWWSGVGISLLLAAMSWGCSSQAGCDDYYKAPSYRITVEDSATGALICDAQVLMNGTEVTPWTEDCSYAAGIPDGVPTVTMMASKVGYASTSRDVPTAYETDACDHAITTEVKLTLKPE